MSESTLLGEIPAVESAAGAVPEPAGALKRTAVRNAFWNWLGVGAELSVAILLTPFLIHRLGEAAYGTWIVIGALAGYLGVLDFGLRGSVGRYIAFYRARHDREGVLATLNTAGAVLIVVGLISLGLVVLAAHSFELWAEAPPELVPEARRALLIIGLQLASFLVLRIFDATLWGLQRFDLLNAVDVPAAVTRGALSAWVVASGHGLVGLACVTLGVTLAVGLAKAALTWAVDHDVHFSLAHIRLNALREMWNYGFWNFLMSLGMMARSQLSPVLIGGMLGVSWVTPFSIVMRLVGTAATLVSAGSGVLAPMATAIHAQDDHARQRRLFLESGKFCVAASLFFFSLFVCLGKPLLRLWLGPKLESAWLPLVIIGAGELLPVAVAVSENTMLGMARNRPLALRGALECLTALSLAWPLGRVAGLTGICVGLAVAATLWRGAFMLYYAGKLVDVTPAQYFWSAASPVLGAVALPIGGLAWASWRYTPSNWWTLILSGSVFGVVYGIVFLGSAIGWNNLCARFRTTLGATTG